jgi:hypothetical protein
MTQMETFIAAKDYLNVEKHGENWKQLHHSKILKDIF